MRERDWISTAFQEAENNSAITSAKEVARLEKCGCRVCDGMIKKIYTEWWRWGQIGKPVKVIYKGEKLKQLTGK